ncbi:MAG: SGNH/GDSL hydrolase family protein [Alphaproteobacteria bacterium]|nr:SGNH/GDSL hydrolase family protein [Alphaproteobacteria bacterium]
MSAPWLKLLLVWLVLCIVLVKVVDAASAYQNRVHPFLLCLGDSVTLGGADRITPGQEFCTLMARAAGRRPANAGKYNDTATNAEARLPAILASLPVPPACMTVMLGENDIFDGTGPDAYRKALENIIAYARKQQIPVTLISPFPATHPKIVGHEKPYLDVLGDIAEREGLPYIDLYKELDKTQLPLSSKETISFDEQHPNERGHAAIFAMCKKPEYAAACACNKNP